LIFETDYLPVVMSYCRTTPCADCPFRTDIPAYLSKARVREIEHSLERSEFHCHKTTEHDDDGEVAASGKELHCAGALILKEKLGESSQMVRIAERMGMYDASKLDMDAPVFDSFTEMAAAQPRLLSSRG
jgi:hypothetical protein